MADPAEVKVHPQDHNDANLVANANAERQKKETWYNEIAARLKAKAAATLAWFKAIPARIKSLTFGQGVAWLYIIGYSLVITVFFSYLGILGGLDNFLGLGKIPLFLLLGGIFGIECYIHKNLYLDAVPALFKISFWKGAFNPKHSWKRLTFCAGGLFCAIAGGSALGALTFVKCGEALLAIFSVVGFSCPPVGITILGASLAGAAFFAFTGLIFDWVVKIADKGYFTGLKKFCLEMYSGNAQVRLEGFFKFLIIGGVLAVAVLGMIATLGTVQVGLENFLKNLHVDTVASKLASYITVYVPMAIVRCGWVVHSIAAAFSKVVNWIVDRINNKINDAVNWTNTVSKGIKALAHGLIYHPFAEHGDFVIEAVTGCSAASATTLAAGAGGVMAGGIGVYAAQKELETPKSIVEQKELSSEEASKSTANFARDSSLTITGAMARSSTFSDHGVKAPPSTPTNTDSAAPVIHTGNPSFPHSTSN